MKKNKFVFGKKAQVTLFIILGLVVLSISTIVVTINKESVESEISNEFLKTALSGDTKTKTIKNYFRDVAYESSVVSLKTMAESGGFVYGIIGFNYSANKTKYTVLDYDGYDVLYHVTDYTFNNKYAENPWNVSYYPCFRKGLPMNCTHPTMSANYFYGEYNYRLPISEDSNWSSTNMLKMYLEQNIEKLIDWNTTNKSFIIDKKGNTSVFININPSTDTLYDNSNVQIYINYHITLVDRSNPKNTFNIDEIEVNVPAKFYSMTELANSIAISEAYKLNYTPSTDYPPDLNRAGFKIIRFNNVNNTPDSIVEIYDDNFNFYGYTNFSYKFAIKNRPPVLEYIYYPPGESSFYIREGDNFTLDVNSTDPDDEGYKVWFKTIVRTSSISGIDAFRHAAKFENNTHMSFNTTGMVGSYQVIVVADDFAIKSDLTNDPSCCDYQNITVVVNDVPKVNFTMTNGYYWDENMLVNPYSLYDYNFRPSFGSNVQVPGNVAGTYVRDPKEKMLHVPCTDSSGTLTYQDRIPREEYVFLNATVIDSFQKQQGTLTYVWSYTCRNDTDIFSGFSDKKLLSCNQGGRNSECMAKIECPELETVVIKLSVFDGLDNASYEKGYKYVSCLSCRPCCIAQTYKATKEDFCQFTEPITTRTKSNDYYVSNLGGSYYYGREYDIDEIKTLNSIFTTVTHDAFNILKLIRYDNSTILGEGHDRLFIVSSIADTDPDDLYISSDKIITGTVDNWPIKKTSDGRYVFANQIKDGDFVNDFVGMPGYEKSSRNNFSLMPFKTCALIKDATFAGSNVVIPNYMGGGTALVYQPVLYYPKLKCNGYNSFCDPQNLWFGDGRENEVKPDLVKISGETQVVYSDMKCQKLIN
jgi:hypothetical protein